MKNYIVRIEFDHALIYSEEVKAGNKKEAYAKAKKRLAKKLFRPSKLTNYCCDEK